MSALCRGHDRRAGDLEARLRARPCDGSSPIGTYKKLVESCEKGLLDFSGVRTVNLDEYCGLSGDNPNSYRYFMNDNLFDHVNIDKANTHVPNGFAEDLEAEAARYEAFIEFARRRGPAAARHRPHGHIGFNEPTDHFPDDGAHGRADREHDQRERAPFRAPRGRSDAGDHNGHRPRS